MRADISEILVFRQIFGIHVEFDIDSLEKDNSLRRNLSTPMEAFFI